MYEESHPVDCPVNSVTAWRLVRASRAALESLVRRSASGILEDISPIVTQNRAIRNMTPRVGMLREDIWQRYGQPRSVWMNPENGEALWEYPQFGLTLIFDHEDMLKRWKLASGKRQLGPDQSGASTSDKQKDPAQHLPPIDFTDRLRELEERQDRNLGSRPSCIALFDSPALKKYLPCRGCIANNANTNDTSFLSERIDDQAKPNFRNRERNDEIETTRRTA